MKRVLIEPHLLPCIEYFSRVCDAGELLLETSEHFVKQSYRTRYRVNTPSGAVTLIVPVTNKSGKVPLRDVRIDYGQKWQNHHWRTIESSYGNAPFFEHYAQHFHDPIFRKWESLTRFSLELLTICLKLLELHISVRETLSYEKVSEVGITDLRNRIKQEVAPSSQNHFRPVPYTQVFGSAFVENLSLLDLLFCKGPDARKIVRESVRSNH